MHISVSFMYWSWVYFVTAEARGSSSRLSLAARGKGWKMAENAIVRKEKKLSLLPSVTCSTTEQAYNDDEIIYFQGQHKVRNKRNENGNQKYTCRTSDGGCYFLCTRAQKQTGPPTSYVLDDGLATKTEKALYALILNERDLHKESLSLLIYSRCFWSRKITRPPSRNKSTLPS